MPSLPPHSSDYQGIMVPLFLTFSLKSKEEVMMALYHSWACLHLSSHVLCFDCDDVKSSVLCC